MTEFRFVSAKKNGGTCFDNNGFDKFKCTCTPQFFGERCEVDRCDFYECGNNGICIVTLLNDIPTPQCECQENFGGKTCNVDLCSDIKCGNGTCIGGNCQCDEGFVSDGNVCLDICDGFQYNDCVDLCDDIFCGGGSCLGGICSCNTGYVNVRNFCEETCALGPCKELIKISQTNNFHFFKYKKFI